jgi:hypothetical protein
MFRCNKLVVCMPLMVLLMALFLPCRAMTIYWPKPDQTVRERVKISIPGKSVPKDTFISVLVGEPDKEIFVLAVNTEDVRAKDGTINIFWNSKSAYRTVSNPKDDHFFKDGGYNIKIEVHRQSGNTSGIIDSGSVPVVLKNKIARPNPAPGIRLVNRMSFGQVDTYQVTSDVQVFEVVSGVALPIVGGLGMSGEFKVVQSVEDVRSTGEYLLRYRIEDNPAVIQFGQKTKLYENEEIKPQLYRLMDKYGHVTDRNMFSKQAKFSITDILPVLPGHAVKEGDSWPDKMSLKLDGLTDVIELSGNCALDSFEWQNGRECVKLISQMQGKSSISLAGGKIYSSDDAVKAEVITYFDYKNGKTVKRDVTLEFPAVVEPGAGDPGQTASAQQAAPQTRYYAASPFGDERGSRANVLAGTSGSASRQNTSLKKGKVQINSSIALVK